MEGGRFIRSLLVKSGVFSCVSNGVGLFSVFYSHTQELLV